MPRDGDIHKAAYKGDLDEVRQLLKSGVDPDTPGASQRTALHRAIAGDQTSVVEFLLDNKANVNVKDKSGRTPLHWAAVKRVDRIHMHPH